jgi:hypothetical protein
LTVLSQMASSPLASRGAHSSAACNFGATDTRHGANRTGCTCREVEPAAGPGGRGDRLTATRRPCTAPGGRQPGADVVRRARRNAPRRSGHGEDQQPTRRAASRRAPVRKTAAKMRADYTAQAVALNSSPSTCAGSRWCRRGS